MAHRDREVLRGEGGRLPAGLHAADAEADAQLQVQHQVVALVPLVDALPRPLGPLCTPVTVQSSDSGANVS